MSLLDAPLADLLQTIDSFRPAWQSQARCRGMGHEVFFIAKGQHQSFHERAKAICAICPVKEECLAYSVSFHDRFGIWGGMSVNDRRRGGFIGGENVPDPDLD